MYLLERFMNKRILSNRFIYWYRAILNLLVFHNMMIWMGFKENRIILNSYFFYLLYNQKKEKREETII